MRPATALLMLAFVAMASSWATAQAQSPASAPVSAPMAAPKAPPAPPKIVYAPTRSFSQWVDDLPKDPALLVGFIVSLLSGTGFLFVIYAVGYELVMGIPYKRQSFHAGGFPVQGSGKLVK